MLKKISEKWDIMIPFQPFFGFLAVPIFFLIDNA